MRRHGRTVALALALGAFAVTAPLAWTGVTPITNACDFTASSEEGAELSSRTSIWPPGVRCNEISPDGARAEELYVTWYELTLAALFAAGVGLVSALLLGAVSGRRFLKASALAVLVFIAASAAFFVV